MAHLEIRKWLRRAPGISEGLARGLEGKRGECTCQEQVRDQPCMENCSPRGRAGPTRMLPVSGSILWLSQLGGSYWQLVDGGQEYC